MDSVSTGVRHSPPLPLVIRAQGQLAVASRLRLVPFPGFQKAKRLTAQSEMDLISNLGKLAIIEMSIKSLK